MTWKTACGTLLFSLLVLVFPATTALADDVPGQAEFDQSLELLAQGQFEDAMATAQKAVELNPDNQEWADQLFFLRRLVMVRKIAADEADERWPQAVIALHNFYLGNGFAKLALPLDQRAYELDPSRTNGANLAETYLALEQNAEAIGIIDVLLEQEEDVGLRLTRALLSARMGEVEVAREHLAKTPEEFEAARGDLYYSRACTYTLIGEADKAIANLVRCFQLTPPSMLDGAKEWAKEDADLDKLHETPEFAKALETASTVKDPQGGCGGCAGCPSSGSCDKEQEGGGCPGGEGDKCPDGQQHD